MRHLTRLAAGLVAIAMAGEAGAWCVQGPGRVHPNGGGWVGPTATVAETAYVGPQARVCDNARVTGQARIRDGSIIIAGAQISGQARIRDNAMINAGAQVDGHAVVNGGVVSGGAQVSGTAVVDKHAHITGKGTGECGHNGTLKRVNDPSTDMPEWGPGGRLSNPIDPGNAQTTE